MKNLFKILALVLALVFVFTSCKKKIEPNPIPQVEDGMYVVGNSIFSDSMQLANVMIPGTIDDYPNPSKLRDGLYYKFMYVTSAGDGFVIKQQKGAETIVWGASLTETSTDTVWSGDIVKDGDNLTVPKNGFYMLAVDFSTSKVFVYRVNTWNVVGSFNNWGDDTIPMTEKSIDKENASWEITNVVLRADSYKFRINRHWNYKIAEDAGKDVYLQTNLGTDLKALVQGGDNIENTVSGEYTIVLNWNFAKGFSATASKTADLNETDWTGVPLELVGSGVSSSNTLAVADTSSWGWGNILHDDLNAPVNASSVYTWTWTNDTLEASQGFKIRTINAQAPANGNGAYFDAGFSALNTSASYSGVADDGGNLTVDVRDGYDITMVIDATNGDTKSITIVKHTK